MLIGPLLLLVWHPRLAIGAQTVPRRSWWGLGVLTILTGLVFRVGWGLGIRYQSARYVWCLLVLNIVLLGCAWWLLWRASRAQSFRRTLLAHTWVVGWLVWVAFPWLGELP
jgi:hypothetical protein